MGATSAFGSYVYAHQQWMMQAAAGPLMAAALRLVSSGGVQLLQLARARRTCVHPWHLDQQGNLVAPFIELAAMPALAHA